MKDKDTSVGSHLVLGFEGNEPTSEFLDFLNQEWIGGVILFARNLTSREQITTLIDRLKEAAMGSLLVGVDHEGGRVFRLPAGKAGLPPPFTSLPPARTFGHYYKQTGDIDLIQEIAALIAEELRSVGFNLNFAPVLDVDTCPKNPIIGDRSFNQDPEAVAAIGTAFVRGFAQAGLLSCGKHFPGHGDTCEDSHLTLPIVKKTEEVLQSCELIPFKHLIDADIPSLMTAHILFSEIDADSCGTLSRSINQNLLRDKLGFKGVLFSDDLLMKGVSEKMSVPEAALRALMAGCDALLICRDFELQKETLTYLKKHVSENPALQEQLKKSVLRLEHLKSQLKAWPPLSSPFSPDRLREKLALIIG